MNKKKIRAVRFTKRNDNDASFGGLHVGRCIVAYRLRHTFALLHGSDAVYLHRDIGILTDAMAGKLPP